MTDTQPAGTPAAGTAGVVLPVGHGRVGWSDAARRHEWAAAYRRVADQFVVADYDWIRSRIMRWAEAIESGVLTPWADTPEPSTPPAQPPHTAPAAAGGHPGTLDGPGVLGRALVDRWDDAWWHAGGDRWRWRTGREAVYRSRGELEAFGPVREVLLVDPAAGRVLDAAREWRHACTAPTGLVGPYNRAVEALAAAVDAYDRPTTSPDVDSTGNNITPEAKPELLELLPGVDPAWAGTCLCEDKEAHDPDCRQGHGPECGVGCWSPQGCPLRYRRAKPAPEPAGDGPGWDRALIENQLEALTDMDHAAHGIDRDLPDQLRALLTDRDALHAQRNRIHRVVESTRGFDLNRLRNERDAARAELAEYRDDLQRARELIVTLTDARGQRDMCATERDNALREADRLRGAMPDGITGYHVHQPDGTDRIYNPADVTVMIRKEGGSDVQPLA